MSEHTEHTPRAETGDVVTWATDGVLWRGEVTEQKGSWSTVATDQGELKVRTKHLEVWDAETEDDEADEPKRAMSKTLNAYKPTYKPTVTHNGTKSLSNGDNVAQALAAMEPDAVVAAAERILGLDEGTLVEKYQHLNPGQRRMNSGNRIRGAIRRGDLTIDEVEAKLGLH